MKKKLLLTLGCSFTEGVGCYEPSTLDNNGNPLYNYNIVFKTSLDRFHQYGWPAQLQKKIKYDFLWNLGKGGASNSLVVKRWFECLSDTKLSEQYDVLVIWLVTFSARLSFYKNGKLFSLLPGDEIESNQNLYKSYLNFLGNSYTRDMMLETYFYVNVIKNICKLSNYKFLYVNVNKTEGTQLDTLMQSSDNSLNIINNTYNILDLDPTEYTFCGHPNEKGYEIIAERIFNVISQNHPQWVNDAIPEKYEMKYLGEPRQW